MSNLKNPITKEILLYVIEGLRSAYAESEEIIPVYTESEIDNLINCIDRIYLGYYPTFEEKICNLIYNLTEGHYLSNGNKRVALIVTMGIFILEAPDELKISPNYAVMKDLILGVAKGDLNKEALQSRFAEMIISDK